MDAQGFDLRAPISQRCAATFQDGQREQQHRRTVRRCGNRIGWGVVAPLAGLTYGQTNGFLLSRPDGPHWVGSPLKIITVSWSISTRVKCFVSAPILHVAATHHEKKSARVLSICSLRGSCHCPVSLGQPQFQFHLTSWNRLQAIPRQANRALGKSESTGTRIINPQGSQT